jgi:hypothetical protein
MTFFLGFSILFESIQEFIGDENSFYINICDNPIFFIKLNKE